MDAPFFEPMPEPEADDPWEQEEVDLPWVLPVHVVGVVVPLDVDVHRGPDVVVRVTHIVAYRRGLEVHVGTWLRPGARRDLGPVGHGWHEQEPRVGIRLADGTRMGHRHPHAPSPPDETSPSSTFTQISGTGGGLHTSSAWWVHPLPAGDSLDVVVQWEHQGVPEVSVAVDLAPLREAAEQEDVLWDPPPGPRPDGFGWFAYATTGGSAFASSATVASTDEPDEQPRDDEG